jgi:uncharacterized protein YbjT (DUF2867 family)
MENKRTYVVTGATGNVGDKVTRGLLARGHTVRAFGRDRARLKPLEELGAIPIVGNMHDEDSVTEAFRGADAALLIAQGNRDARDYRRKFALAGETYAAAAAATGLKSAVFVSSLGAHDQRHRGLLLIHGDVEHILSQVPDLNLVNLRAPIFFEDLFYFLAPLRAVGGLTWPIDSDAPIDTGSTRDVADVAVKLLGSLDFRGKTTVELHGRPGITLRRIAELISEAVGRTVPARPLSYQGDVEAMVAAGFGRDFSILMNDAWATVSRGLVREEALPGTIQLPGDIGDFIKRELAPAILAPAHAQGAAAAAE